jgi:predicted dehydrogenase
MTGNRLIKAGVIGVGYLGKHHARIYNETPGVKLVGVSDIDRNLGMKIANNLGVSFFESPTELLEETNVVSVSTPTATHYRLAKKALLSGIHILMEKPITERPEEAEELIDLSKQKGLILQVGHIERFNPAIIAVSSLIKEPMFVEAQRIAIYNERGTDVAVVLDLMVHDIDIVLAFLHSDVKKIEAIGVPILSEEYDIANARLEFKNGAIASLTTSRVSYKKERKIRFFQRDMYISVDYLSHQADVWRRMEINGKPCVKKEELEIIPKEPLRAEIESFVRCVRSGDSPVVNGEDGKRAIQLAYRIIESMDKHRRIMGI